MLPLPFALPAVLDLASLRGNFDVTLVQIYDRYPVAAARAACILSREYRPQRPVVVLAELEKDGLTADEWSPEALLALFEGVGASALVLSCPADSEILPALLQELVPRARIPLGACIPPGAEAQLVPQLSAARLLLALDEQSLSDLHAQAGLYDFFSPLPPPEDLEDEQQQELLYAVTCGQLFTVDPAIDIEADCDLHDGASFERWLLDQEDEGWGAVRIHIETGDELALFDENQYLLRVPVALASDDPALFEHALRRFCGLALYDGTCGFEPEFLAPLQKKYGLVVL